ncbi:MAG: LSU ribosomal protein L28p @ LSU ribosomal protein L28p, zinc-dependent, partial [uncultured Nocardioidaceae bacterium]
WLPSATSAPRARASATTGLGPARSRSVASTRTSSACVRPSTARPSVSTCAPAASRPARSPA